MSPTDPLLMRQRVPADARARAPGHAADAGASPATALRRPLSAIRVLDLTNVLSGPFCAYQLAQLGADVIKVEMPGSGDLARQLGADEALNARLMGASFLAQNGGKRSVTANLKSEDGRRILRDLARTADVLVENFRPGVMDRLGVGHDALAKVNPSLVYCAISGFGQTGPMRDAPAYDQIIQGLSGVMSVTGDERCAPMRVGYPVADTIGGLTAAFAIASALVRRATSGEGAFIDVSMLDCTLGTMGWVVSNFLIAGQAPVPMGNDNFTAAPSGAFTTADGLINIAANKQEQFEALATAVGCVEWLGDPRFADREARKRNRAELNRALERALQAKPATEWEAILNRIGIPAGRVLSVPEALASTQVAERGVLATIDDVPGVDRAITVTRTGFKLTGGDPDVTLPPPRLGEHTHAVLKDLGYSDDEIARLRSAGSI
jgi:crotonobetainyl-CoA:carnitine CoA-transferase CaiB-like acyl-CoA transferase